MKYEEREVEELLLENFAEHFQKISEDDLSIGFLYMKAWFTLSKSLISDIINKNKHKGEVCYEEKKYCTEY